MRDKKAFHISRNLAFWTDSKNSDICVETTILKRIIDLPDHVLGIEASGQVAAGDYQSVLVPAMEDKFNRSRKLRLLYVLGEKFDGYTGGAAWEDAKVGLKHLTRFERVAVVSDVDWLKISVKAFGFVMPGEVRVFDNDHLQEAREWISQPRSTGKLSFEYLDEQGVLILRPHGELEAADFERIFHEIDPHIEKEGSLMGVMIIAEHFPGWDDLSAFAAHMRFVKEHRGHIKRLAVVTDDHLLSATPVIASHLIVPESRNFPMSKKNEALAWVSQG